MKKKTILKYMMAMLVVLVAATAWFGTKKAAGAVQRLESIEAIYVGEAVAVGEEINLKDFYVMAKYQIYDGMYTSEEYLEIKKGFTISPSVIKHKGDNTVVVTYQGKTCTTKVEGKTVETIMASYIGDDVYVGATIPVGKIEVYAYYSDGSEKRINNFTLSDTKVTKEGNNTILVSYEGKTDYIYVYGKAPLAVEELLVTYIGDPVIVGNAISKDKFEVYAVYNDGSDPKKITNFNISPSVIKLEGENEITVSYGSVSAVEYVYGEERYITDMKARYTGPGVIVGKKVNKNEIEVIATFNDKSEEAIDEFELYGEEILFEGENIVLVYCDSYMADITVMGVKGFAANYDNAKSAYFTSEDFSHYSLVTLGMNVGLDSEKFELRNADPQLVRYMVQRVVPSEDYLGFELFYDDDEMVLEFPMAVKVTVPSSFDPDRFGVYYTPNKETIMAKVDGEFLDESKTEYEFIVYEPGMYILVNEVSNRLVTEILVETEIKLRENRSYSLNPVVFPLSAENREVTYWSTDENVASVSANGKIRTYSEGTCEIWIEAEDGSGVYVIVEVEVKNGR